MSNQPNQIESLKENIKELAERIEILQEVSVSCPSDQDNYMSIDNVCYYFDNFNRTFDEAQNECKHIFGPSGKIYEPKNLHEAKAVFVDHYIEKLDGKPSWVGITDRITEGDYKYASTGTSVPFSSQFWGPFQPIDDSGEDDCVVTYYENGKWADFPCSDKKKTICELRQNL